MNHNMRKPGHSLVYDTVTNQLALLCCLIRGFVVHFVYSACTKLSFVGLGRS